MRMNSQSGLVSVKERNNARIRDKDRFKQKWAENFENLLNYNKVAGKNRENK